MKKNRFAFIILFIISFLCSPLFLSYSFAFDKDIYVNGGSFSTAWNDRSNLPNVEVASGYTFRDVYDVWSNFNTYPSSYSDTFYTMVQALTDNGIFIYAGMQSSSLKVLICTSPIDVGNEVIVDCSAGDVIYYIDKNSYYKQVQVSTFTCNSSGYYSFSITLDSPISYQSCNKRIKSLTYTNGSGYVWTGDYLYDSPSIILGGGSFSGDNLITPTNQELRNKIQAFYDSDFFKNSTDFDKFIVLYNYKNGYYDFICTKNSLVQEIFYDGAYDVMTDFSSPVTWFRLDSNFGNLESIVYPYYWLYSSTYDSNDFNFEGKGSQNDLRRVRFDSTYSIVVYCSYNYSCNKHYPDSSDNVSEVISSGSFTFDESLDPTTSIYDPFSVVVSSNPVDTILGNYDVSSISEILTNNLISYTEMSWVFTAVSSLFSVFSSLILIVCVMLLISKIIGG